MRRLLPEDRSGQLHTYTLSGTARTTESFTAPLFEMTVKAVCRDCNGGWMNELETGTKALVSGMLLGNGRALHETGQTTLAAWATLKALMLQQVHAAHHRWIPDATYRSLYELKTRPPEDLRVYTAAVQWQREPGFYNQTALSPFDPNMPDRVESPRGYLSSFSVLHLVLQVFGSYVEFNKLTHPPAIAPALRQIWPPLGSFTWPPGPALTEAGLRTLYPATNQ